MGPYKIVILKPPHDKPLYPLYYLLFLSQGLLDPLLALNLSTYLFRELHPVPWAVARKVTKCLLEVFSKPHRPLYKVPTIIRSNKLGFTFT